MYMTLSGCRCGVVRWPGASVYCAGVAADESGQLITAGGRVLNVCGRGPTVAAARETAYAAVRHISWPGMHHREDIAAHV